MEIKCTCFESSDSLKRLLKSSFKGFGMCIEAWERVVELKISKYECILSATCGQPSKGEIGGGGVIL
jgi:hypothetical protein